MPLTPHQPERTSLRATVGSRCPVWLHAITFVVLSFILAMGGVFFGRGINARCGFDSNLASILVPGALLTAGLNTPIWVFLKFIPARCPGCRGRSWGRFAGGNLRYICGRCGRVTAARVNSD